MKLTTWFQNKFNKKSNNPASSVPDTFSLIIYPNLTVPTKTPIMMII